MDREEALTLLAEAVRADLVLWPYGEMPGITEDQVRECLDYERRVRYPGTFEAVEFFDAWCVQAVDAGLADHPLHPLGLLVEVARKGNRP